MRLEITAQAAQDLRNLHGHGIREYGAAAADRYLAELFAKFEVIAQWPFAARERPNAQPPVRLSPQRAHNVLHTIAENTVVVLRVFHHAVNWIDLL